MGVYDRDYMTREKKPLKPSSPEDTPRPYSGPKASPWARLKFRLWLLFRRKQK